MNLYDIDLVTIDGKAQKMDDYRNKTLLIVRVTRLLEALEKKSKSLKAIHFAVHGAPTPFRLSPPPNLRELLLAFQGDVYASEFAVDLSRRRLTESLHLYKDSGLRAFGGNMGGEQQILTVKSIQYRSMKDADL